MFKFVSPLKTTDSLQTFMAAALCVMLAGTVLTALGFQYIGGMMPCKLCLVERVPYYIGAPLMLIAFAFSWMRAPGVLVRGLFIIVVGLMAYNLVVSIYHAGAEYKWWLGPSDCATAPGYIPEDVSSLLDNINTNRPASCSDAPGYFLGLSMAAWNGVACLFYGILAAIGAFASFKSWPKS